MSLGAPKKNPTEKMVPGNPFFGALEVEIHCWDSAGGSFWAEKSGGDWFWMCVEAAIHRSKC